MTKLQTEVENIKKMINHAQNIAVVGHHNPDGDCIGCCVAMSLWLESKGKNVAIFLYYRAEVTQNVQSYTDISRAHGFAFHYKFALAA